MPHGYRVMAESSGREEGQGVPRWGNARQGSAQSSDRPPSPPGSNNECEMFVCNCDRTAAMCFAKAPYDPAHHYLDKKKYCSS